MKQAAKTEAAIAKIADKFNEDDGRPIAEAYRERVGKLQAHARDLAQKLDAIVDLMERYRYTVITSGPQRHELIHDGVMAIIDSDDTHDIDSTGQPTVQFIDNATAASVDYTITGHTINATDFDADLGTDAREYGIDSTGQRFAYDTQPLPLLNPEVTA
jgi:hypothetical protein